ncbi:hypothetical protein LY56_03583, partial [Roseinatronobacter thiooxidans]
LTSKNVKNTTPAAATTAQGGCRHRTRWLTRYSSGRAARVPAHPDPRIRALQEQTRECGLRQAIERLRLARARVRKRVLLLTKIPLPRFPVTQLVTFDQIAPPRLIAALLEAGGILRMSAAGLAQDAPQTFSSVKAAERWLEREGREQVNTPEPLIESYYRFGGINCVLARMRLPGQRGPKPTPVLIVSPQDPQGALRQHFGEISEFTIQQKFMSDGCDAQAESTVTSAPVIMAREREQSEIPPALKPPEMTTADEPSFLSVEAAREPDASPVAESLQDRFVPFSTATDRVRGAAGVPKIKPHSAAAKVLLAIEAGSRTPGAISTSSGLGYRKTHIALQALKSAEMLREMRDGTYSRL